jgi:hypothetical protein
MPTAIASAGRVAGVGTLLALAAWGMAAYPLPPWPLATALAAYALALWRWPVIFLIVVPTVLPSLDMGLWTGWTSVNEADLFLLVTLALLVLRTPLHTADLMPKGLALIAIVTFAAVIVGAAIVGLASPLGYSGESGNPFLRPDNALRLAKGLGEALVLIPFLRQRNRAYGDASVRLGCGIAAGLLAVTLEVLTERALFAGILDFHTDYRVAGPFSSMHVGGGHIGAYVALALPFTFALGLVPRRRLLPLLAAGAALAGAYTLVVTFARTGYAAGLVGVMVTGLGLLLAQWRRGGSARLLAITPIVLVLAAMAVAASSGLMRQRLSIAATDLLTRELNWREGWSVRDPDLSTSLFGMGLGTYQRTMLSRAATNRPTDFGLSTDGEGTFVWMRVETPFYLGQKVTLPSTGSVHLTLRFRAGSPKTPLAFSLCDKVLLYAGNCQIGQIVPRAFGTWENVTAVLPVANLGAGYGPIHRPVELSLFDPMIDTTIAIRDVSLTDDSGESLLANGDFAHGLNRWLFTDDSHVSWRILNQYLMLLFETGVIGLAAYLGLAALAVAGGMTAAFRGGSPEAPMGAAVAGSVISFLISGLFDNVLEAPRVATLFYLTCLLGLLMWERNNRV